VSGCVSDLATGTIGATAPGHYGAGPAQVTLSCVTLTAAWNLQGDARQASFAEEARQLFGVALPQMPNTTARREALTALWLGPRSWLFVAGGTPALVDFEARRDAVNALRGALFDMSASRIAYRVAGASARSVLAGGCPLDLHSRTFTPGGCAQSLYGQVNALYYRPDETQTFIVMVARSFARDVWHALCVSAAQYGYGVTPAVSFP
jgi:sarcosine oxidase, subunit gamma